MAKVTQRDRVLQYCKDFGSITRAQAFNDLGICELSTRILELEERGHKFKREKFTVRNRYGDKCQVIKYILE